jgi:predicted phospho-2-dehydro-3-deoxyheptonate aldolase
MEIDGKEIRMRRICDHKTGKFVLIPMDHGVTTGPIKGLANMRDTINKIAAGGATAVGMHKGMVGTSLLDAGGDVGLILHISASTLVGPYPFAKIIVGTVEEALKVGADAVSVHINVGADTERDMLKDLGNISNACREWHVPLLAMMYSKGKKMEESLDPGMVKHIARIGAELGADVIKTDYPGDKETFREVVEGCPVPVLIAGGPRANSDLEVLQMVRDAMDVGGMGVSMGRNVFQNDDVTGMVRALRKVIIEDASAEEAYKELSG